MGNAAVLLPNGNMPVQYPFHFSQGGRYAIVCDGCPIADIDNIPDNTMGVANLVPTCTETPENTQSDGANTSIQDIRIDRGYWRATDTSKIILPCHNEDACLGGGTDAAGYCLEGYHGPCKTTMTACFFGASAP